MLFSLRRPGLVTYTLFISLACSDSRPSDSNTGGATGATTPEVTTTDGPSDETTAAGGGTPSSGSGGKSAGNGGNGPSNLSTGGATRTGPDGAHAVGGAVGREACGFAEADGTTVTNGSVDGGSVDGGSAGDGSATVESEVETTCGVTITKSEVASIETVGSTG